MTNIWKLSLLSLLTALLHLTEDVWIVLTFLQPLMTF